MSQAHAVARADEPSWKRPLFIAAVGATGSYGIGVGLARMAAAPVEPWPWLVPTMLAILATTFLARRPDAAPALVGSLAGLASLLFAPPDAGAVLVAATLAILLALLGSWLTSSAARTGVALALACTTLVAAAELARLARLEATLEAAWTVVMVGWWGVVGSMLLAARGLAGNAPRTRLLLDATALGLALGFGLDAFFDWAGHTFVAELPGSTAGLYLGPWALAMIDGGYVLAGAALLALTRPRIRDLY